MQNRHETTAFNELTRFAEVDSATTGGDAETSTTTHATRKTTRPATAILRKSVSAHISPALEAAETAANGRIHEATDRLHTPLENLTKLFQLIMDDLNSLPILQSEILLEINGQLDQIAKVMHNLSAHRHADTAEAITAELFDALRGIRTPLANMQGLLSLVLDDRSAMPRPVADMLLLAFEQLEKLATLIDEISERLNLAGGKITVHYRHAALDQILEHAIRHARDESFESELVYSNQVAADMLPDIDATSSQCLEALVRHALLDTLNFANEMPVGLFVYIQNPESKQARLVVEFHDHCHRADETDTPAPKSLDQQIVTEMTQALQGECKRTREVNGETTTTVTVPCLNLCPAPALADDLPVVVPPFQGVALLSPDRRLPGVIETSIHQRLITRRIGDFKALREELLNTFLPTVFVDVDLLNGLSPEQCEQFGRAAEHLDNLFVLQHAEAEVGPFGEHYPILWDDDLLAITGMLEQPFRPGGEQENLMLLTGSNLSEIRPWRKLLSSTGYGSLWWPARRPVASDRFPSKIGGIVVLTDSTRAIPTNTWNAMAQLNVRERRILVLTGHGTCQLPSARGWDIYRPNVQACDDTLRRYILFNSPTHQQPRVAVIEDDVLMRKLLSSAVEDQAQIVEMASVAEALDKLRTQSFDVILLDLYLPDGSGLKILDALRTDPCLAKAARTPIITLTGSSDLDIAQQALDHGAAEVLVKPVPMQVLRQKIALLTRRNRSTRISGPMAVPEPTKPAPTPAPASKRQPGVSKIINLRALKMSANETAQSSGAAVGD